ncbi:dethiobiotin synthase [Nocardia carnea]|uniref:dethiobiotin synthase n=1 Tax=Nocardia carnea TaxID=37328 RepID=UPI0032AF6177
MLFVTGTSTEVGKSVTTAALAAIGRAAGLSVAICKPAQTGVTATEPGDLATITALSGVTDTLELARYPDPLAPATAARRCGAPLLTLPDTAAAVSALGSTADLVLVEGAGGLLVRLGEFTLLDLARELAAPVLVVAASGLGTLNHSELTIRALRQEGVRCAGLVVGSWPEQPDLATGTNRTDLPEVTDTELVGAVPAGAGSWPPPRFRAAAPDWFDREWSRTQLGISLPADQFRPEPVATDIQSPGKTTTGPVLEIPGRPALGPC